MKQTQCFFIFCFLWISGCLLHAEWVDVLYFTDAHRIYPVDDVAGGRGGVARLKTVAGLVREENPNTLLIHGGDICGGVLFGGIYKGTPLVDAFNQIPVDLCNFGQHEFDFGTNHLKGLIGNSNFQWLTSNLKAPGGEPFAGVSPYILKEIDGFQLAFLGLTDAMDSTIEDDGVYQADLFDSVESILPELLDAGVDCLIVLTQTDLETNRKLMRTFDEIDLILTEEQYEYASNVLYEGRRPIVATAGNMSSVARIRISVGRTRNLEVSIIPLDDTVQSDSELLKTEQYYLKEVDALSSEVIATIEGTLDVRSGHTGESKCGNLVTDAFRDWHQSDIGILNSGSLRADVHEGIVTMKSVRSLLPFGNRVCQFSIRGKDLKALLKTRAKQLNGKLLQVSGIAYEYSLSLDQIRVYYNDAVLEDDAVLTVSTSDYLLGKINVPHEILIDSDAPEALEDYKVLASYCKAQKNVVPHLENRIRRVLK